MTRDITLDHYFSTNSVQESHVNPIDDKRVECHGKAK